MADGAYSPLKVIHHPDKLDQLRRGEQPVPAQVQLIISDLCNQDCSFCAFRMSGYTSNQLFPEIRPDGSVNNNPNRMIPYDKVLEILDDCEEIGVKAIQITGGGEPTVHPNHKEIFAAVLERGLELAVVTNGACLCDESIELLMHAKWLRISLDAGCAATYASIRGVRPEVFARVLSNVAKLDRQRKLSGSTMRIGVGYVVTRDNWDEVAQAATLARAHGADNLRISAVFQPEGVDYFRDFCSGAIEQCQEALALATADFKIHNNFGDRLDDLEQSSPDSRFCGCQHFNTYIGADQNVYRCCVLAYNDRGKVGSLKNQRFKDLWKSQAKHDDFATFDATGCPPCMFNDKNRTIAYAIDPTPADVNYV